MRVVWLELIKEVIIRRGLHTKVGILLRHGLGSPVFFDYISYAENIGPAVELFIPYEDTPMIFYSSKISGGRLAKLKIIKIEDEGALKESSFIRYWTEEEFRNKIYVRALKSGVGPERRLLEDTFKLSHELNGWVNIGLVSEVDESRGRDVVDRSLELQSLTLPLMV